MFDSMLLLVSPCTMLHDWSQDFLHPAAFFLRSNTPFSLLVEQCTVLQGNTLFVEVGASALLYLDTGVVHLPLEMHTVHILPVSTSALWVCHSCRTLPNSEPRTVNSRNQRD